MALVASGGTANRITARMLVKVLRAGSPDGGEEFILRVQGDSMVGAGILDGDFVVVHRQQDARNGDIVVALAGDDETVDEATVKRFFRENGRIRLQPENEALEPIFADYVQILGKVVGVFRSVE